MSWPILIFVNSSSSSRGVKKAHEAALGTEIASGVCGPRLEAFFAVIHRKAPRLSLVKEVRERGRGRRRDSEVLMTEVYLVVIDRGSARTCEKLLGIVESKPPCLARGAAGGVTHTISPRNRAGSSSTSCTHHPPTILQSSAHASIYEHPAGKLHPVWHVPPHCSKIRLPHERIRVRNNSTRHHPFKKTCNSETSMP